jgi:5-methylcytosine-specific restriction protein A
MRMNTFLLVWNPKRWIWNDFERLKINLYQGNTTERFWSCRSSKVDIGDRIFIIRLGKEPKGIFSSGHVVGKEDRPHWDKTKNEIIPYVNVKFDKLLNPETEKIISRIELETNEFQPMHWDSQMSGVQIPDDIADHLEKVWKRY